MKKLISLFALLFILAGCSKNYMAEREYYKAEKQLNKISAEALEQDPSLYDPSIEAFQQIIDKYPGTQTTLDSYFKIAELKTAQEKYEEAREIYRKVTVNFSNRREKAAEARYRIALLYQKEDKWGQAEKMLWETAEYHPFEIQGLQAPIVTIIHYHTIDYPDAQRRAYKETLEHYEKLIDQLGPIQASAQVRNFKAIAHSTMRDWEKARDEWISIYNDFPDTPMAAVSLLAAAEASQKMGNAAMSATLYRQFLEKFPEHEMAPQMSVRLGVLAHQQGRFAKAREYYEKALEAFKRNTPSTADVKLLIARSYQAEGQWTTAKKMYHELEVQFGKTTAGLQAPLQVARYYKTQNQPEKANEVLDKAIQHYDNVIAKNPGTNVEKLAWRLKNDALQQKGEWNQVIDQFDSAIDRATTAEEKGKLLLMKTLIVDKQLQDKELALNLYNDFLAQYPDHSLAGLAKSHRERLTQS